MAKGIGTEDDFIAHSSLRSISTSMEASNSPNEVKDALETVNPRTYKHPPWYKGGGGALMDPPWVFVMLLYFERISSLVESLWCALQDEVHIIGCPSAGGCDVIQDGHHVGRHLGFYRKLEIVKKR